MVLNLEMEHDMDINELILPQPLPVEPLEPLAVPELLSNSNSSSPNNSSKLGLLPEVGSVINEQASTPKVTSVARDKGNQERILTNSSNSSFANYVIPKLKLKSDRTPEVKKAEKSKSPTPVPSKTKLKQQDEHNETVVKPKKRKHATYSRIKKFESDDDDDEDDGFKSEDDAKKVKNSELFGDSEKEEGSDAEDDKIKTKQKTTPSRDTKVAKRRIIANMNWTPFHSFESVDDFELNIDQNQIRVVRTVPLVNGTKRFYFCKECKRESGPFLFVHFNDGGGCECFVLGDQLHSHFMRAGIDYEKMMAEGRNNVELNAILLSNLSTGRSSKSQTKSPAPRRPRSRTTTESPTSNATDSPTPTRRSSRRPKLTTPQRKQLPKKSTSMKMSKGSDEKENIEESCEEEGDSDVANKTINARLAKDKHQRHKHQRKRIRITQNSEDDDE